MKAGQAQTATHWPSFSGASGLQLLYSAWKSLPGSWPSEMTSKKPDQSPKPKPPTKPRPGKPENYSQNPPGSRSPRGGKRKKR